MKGRRSFNSQVLYHQHLVLWEDMWMHCTLYSKTDIGHSCEDGGCLGECGHTSLSAASLFGAMLPRVHLVPMVFLQRWLLFWKVCGENLDPLCTRSGWQILLFPRVVCQHIWVASPEVHFDCGGQSQRTHLSSFSKTRVTSKDTFQCGEHSSQKVCPRVGKQNLT